jgi:hypothetical protein
MAARALLFAVLALTSAVSATAGSIHWEEDVLVVDGKKTFDMAIKTHDFIVMEFYAPVRAGRRAPSSRPLRRARCTRAPRFCANARPRCGPRTVSLSV